MSHSSRPPRRHESSVGPGAADKIRERALKLKLAAIVVLIVAALIYNWYEQRSVSEIADKPRAEHSAETAKKPAPSKTRKTTKPQKATNQETVDRETEKTADPREDRTSQPASSRKPPPAETQTSTPAKPKRIVVDDVTIKDLDGKVVFQGQIDLQPTVDRIAQGKRLRFANDGSTFQNREGRLPRKSAGYYQEWVHPTEDQSGPGPQRVVTGKGGELFYTHDHYKSFKRIR